MAAKFHLAVKPEGGHSSPGQAIGRVRSVFCGNGREGGKAWESAGKPGKKPGKGSAGQSVFPALGVLRLPVVLCVRFLRWLLLWLSCPACPVAATNWTTGPGAYSNSTGPRLLSDFANSCCMACRSLVSHTTRKPKAQARATHSSFLPFLHPRPYSLYSVSAPFSPTPSFPPSTLLSNITNHPEHHSLLLFNPTLPSLLFDFRGAYELLKRRTRP
jgi:hypothetical protein